MTLPVGFRDAPAHKTYDVVIVGGAMHGSATAWFLTQHPDFDGRVLVVERSPTYAQCATALSNSCIRQQFSDPINVAMSQFGAAFVKDLRARMGGAAHVPDLTIHDFGYLYLAADERGADTLRRNQAVQVAHGAGTRVLSPDEIAAAWPFYRLDDIVAGSHNPVDEGYFDGWAVFDAFRRSARENGVEYVADAAVGMTLRADRTAVERVRLASGVEVSVGAVVNASGTRAAATAQMAGIDVPVEPRRRYSWVFTAQRPLDRALPLTIDPSGIHFRQEGPGAYLAGATPPTIRPSTRRTSPWTPRCGRRRCGR